MGDAAAEEDKGGDDIFAEEPDLGDSEILQSSKELHTYLGNLEALDLRVRAAIARTAGCGTPLHAAGTSSFNTVNHLPCRLTTS